MKKQFLRICSTILIIVLLANMLPMSIFAEEFRESLITEMKPDETLEMTTQSDVQIVSEIPSKRTQYTKEFILSNGLHLAAVYPDAVHYEKGGEWAEIDNTLTLKNGKYVNTAGIWNVSFPQQLSDSKSVTIEKDGYTLSFAMAGELRSTGLEIAGAVGGEDVSSVKETAMQVIEDTVAEEEIPVDTTSPTEETTIPETVPENTVFAIEETEPEETIVETVPEITVAVMETEPEITDPMPKETVPTEIEPEQIVTDVMPEQLSVSKMQLSTATVQPLDKAALQENYQYAEMAPEKLYSRLSYANVYQNTDVIYDMDSNQVKESIVMEAYSSTLRGYKYTLNVGEMIPVLEEDGQILFYDAEQKDIVMVMPAPYLMDAAEESSWDVRVQLTGSNGLYTLNYLLPTQWLADSQRAWPVILDPVVEADLERSNIRDITVSSIDTYSNNWGMNSCGWRTNDGVTRTYLKYRELPALTSSDVVVAASLGMYQYAGSLNTTTVEVHKVYGTWESEDLTWEDQDGEADSESYEISFNPIVEDYNTVTAGNEDIDENGYWWDITDLVRGWYESENTGMMFKAPDSVEQGNTKSFKQFVSADFGTETYRPTLYIMFRNNNGLENYWDYTSSSAGRAGTGYINNYTGNLTWIRDDIGFGGNVQPVNIQHIYNLNDAIVPSDNNNSNDSGGNSFYMGYGWRTNYNQLVYQWSENSSYYVWEDDDGTDHYFSKDSKGIYKDEDGLELTLTTTGTDTTKKYCITNKNGNCSYFDTYGRLTEQQNNQQTKSSVKISYTTATGKAIKQITDGAGRKYNFTYSTGLLQKISYTGTDDTEDYCVTFAYSNANLTKVTNQDGKLSKYTYSGNRLLTAQDIDGYTLTYAYHSLTDATWQPYRVASVEESHNNANAGKLTFDYGHNQTTITDHNGNVEILQFNDSGNTVSVQDDEGHAVFSEYARTAKDDTGGKANQLKASSKLQNTVVNYLKYSNYDASSNTNWSPMNSMATTQRSTEQMYLGRAAVKMVTTTSGEETGIANDAFTAPKNKSVTFSAYVKTGAGAVYLALSDGTNTVTSEPLSANSNWTRLQVTYVNDTGATQKITPKILTKASCTTYIDCTQLERGDTASRFNLIENSDFRYTSTGWTSDGFQYTPTTSSAMPEMTNRAMSITGDPTATKQLYQYALIPGSADDCYVVSGWAMGDSAPLTGNRTFGIQVVFHYTDGTYGYFKKSFNADLGSDGNWQYLSMPVVAKKDYELFTVKLVYDYNVNTVYFDGIQLYKEEFGNSYTYDEDGNVISVTDLQDQTTSYEYENNNLTKIIQDNKTKMTYTYDDYHNVKTATTEEGVVYSFDYDEHGNNTEVTIGSGNQVISTSATYTSDGNRLVSTTDALGKVTKYGYNKDTNMLDWVRYPEDDEETQTEYTYDNMCRMKEAVCNTNIGNSLSAEYTYTNDYLTEIHTPSTEYKFSYGNFGLRTKVSAGSITLAEYSYTNDRNNYLQSLDYGNGDAVQYQYDGKGRVVKETYEDGDTVTYAYDNDGNLATVTDSATGRTITYYYDLTDRLMKQVESGTGHKFSMDYTIDTKNRLTKIVEKMNGYERTSWYDYDDDNRIKYYKKGYAQVNYEYDEFGRVTKETNTYQSQPIFTTEYTFVGNSTQVDTKKSTVNKTNEIYTYDYSYDDNGNILTICETLTTPDGAIEYTYNTSYVYDSANQLIRENNQQKNYTHTWTYDNAGNILNRKEYAYTTGSLEDVTLTGEGAYVYENSEWGDLLTEYNGNDIVYDLNNDDEDNKGIGNPTSYNGWAFTWEHGRELTTATKNGVTWTYTYDANGMRTKRTNGSSTYKYMYYGGQLLNMSKDSTNMYFNYKPDGTPMAIVKDGHSYSYITNLQGDVLAIIDQNGVEQVTYEYDAWGKLLSIGGPMADSLGEENPLRYRGYVYDHETGLYYVSSRYYDPEIGRWINADDIGYLGAGSNLTSLNLFTYCGNNPVMGYDPTGHWDWGWEEQAALGTTVLIVGLALLLAAPTGGSSLAFGALALSSSTAVAAGSAMAITGTVMVGDAVAQATVNYAKQSKKSGKERATDKPSWVSQSDVDLGKSSQQNATDLLNNKYGSGNWGKGPRTEFNQIVKWIDRGLKAVILIMADMLMEE